MDLHYSAFISYRHHPQDRKAALEIHRGLERYRIPRDLPGRKRLDRIFLDQEELSATSSLSQSIGEALAHSEYLIVLCSSHTAQSSWVQREIDCFLLSHDRDHILTVLVDGEPNQVIPACLKTRLQEDPETQAPITVSAEPLSCDWRSPSRRHRLQELDRLAAPLLGCPLDSLRQRRKRYRMRRRLLMLSVLLVLSLGMTAYVLSHNRLLQKANREVRKNWEEALRRQSVYLAAEARKALQSGDRITAIHLALEALPDSLGDRPYVPEAELALSSALSVYTPPPGRDQNFCTLKTDAQLVSFLVSEDSSILYAEDIRHTVTAFNPAANAMVGSFSLSSSPRNWAITPQHNLVCFWETVPGQYALACYSPAGEELWRFADPQSVSFLDQGGTTAVLTGSRQVVLLDADTGIPLAPAADLTFPESPEETDWWELNFLQEKDTESDAMILYIRRDSGYAVFRLDPAHGTCTMLLQECGLPFSALSLEDGTTILLCEQFKLPEAAKESSAFQAPSQCMAVCIAADGSRLWSTSFPCFLRTLSDRSAHLKLLSRRKALFCERNGTMVLLDLRSGKLLSNAQAHSRPLYFFVDETDETLSFFDAEGNWEYFQEQDRMTFFSPMFPEPLAQAVVTETQGQRTRYCLSQNGSHILGYRKTWDPHLQSLQSFEGSIDHWFSDGRLLCTVSMDGIIQLFDLEAGSLLWSLDPELDYMPPEPMGFYENRSWLSAGSGGSYLGIGRDPEDMCLYSLSDSDLQATGFYTLAGSHICQLAKKDPAAGDPGQTDYVLVLLDMDTGKQQHFPLCTVPEDESPNINFQLLDSASDLVLLWEQHNQTIWELEIPEGRIQKIRDSVSSRPYAKILADGSYFLGTFGKLSFCHRGGILEKEISTPNAAAFTGCTAPEGFTVLCDDGRLLVMDPQGDLRFSQELGLGNEILRDIQHSPQRYIRWTPTSDGRSMALSFEDRRVGVILDTGSWKPTAFLSQFLLLDPRTDRLLTTAMQEDRTALQWYPRYSLEALKNYGREVLGNTALSQQERMDYGLDAAPAP